MIVAAEVTINRSREAVWAAITNIGNAPNIVSGIQKIEILEQPAQGIIGLKWRETRMLFGKPTSVEKWITEAAENEFYQTRAEDGGFVFVTTKSITENMGGMRLTESHETIPQGIIPTLMSIPMRLFFKGVIQKTALQDLNDIKNALETR